MKALKPLNIIQYKKEKEYYFFNKINLLLIILLFISICLSSFMFYAGVQYADKLHQMYSNSFYSNEPQGGEPFLTDESTSEADIVQKALPSVVSIAAKPKFSFSPFDLIEKEQNIGSGFIISPKGYIVTSKHVISDSDMTYYVKISENKKLSIKKAYLDSESDLAIIIVGQLDKQGLPLGNSDNVRLGEKVITIGTSFGTLTNSVTTGVVSGLNRNITAGTPYGEQSENLSHLIQIDAAINPGNSGSPLLNMKGEVIGVNTAIAAMGENIGFAVPINDLKIFLNKRNFTL